MGKKQKDHDIALDREINIDVEISGILPRKKSYHPIRSLPQTGFKITARSLMHAIGCKTACLPMNDQDECLKAAYLYNRILDLGGDGIKFRRGIDSDLQTNRSNEVGIGMMCLLAHQYWKMPWDQLESIPGRGTRFDYRGHAAGVRAIFEAKGTKYRSKQNRQVEAGLEKKQKIHERVEHFDVEIIISTCFPVGNARPRIIIADPFFDYPDMIFGDQAELFFRYRHFARVMQFIGATRLARQLYVLSNALLHNIDYATDPLFDFFDKSSFEVFKVAGDKVFGKWFDYFVPPHSPRYKHLIERMKSLKLPFPQIRVFQGIKQRQLFSLLELRPESVEFDNNSPIGKVVKQDDLPNASIFPDGTVFMVQLGENE